MTLHHDITGSSEAPVLVLGPSLGTTLHMWDPQVAALARRFRVVRYDHLGHGGSPVPAGPYTVDRLADEVLGVIDSLHVDRFRYAGLSLGGMVGMAIAARAPDRVERLALLCTSAYLPPAQGWFDRATTVRAHGTASITEASLGRWFTPSFTDRGPYAAMLASIPDDGYAACCYAIGDMDLRPVLGKITAPTLVIAGSADPATPPEHGRVIADAVADARLAIVDAAHLANVERSAEVTTLLLNHLEGRA
jgi:3-oxoadipate enol-lactonase